MEHFNYYVVVDHPDYKQDVHSELTATTGEFPVPDRAVNCADAMPWSEYNGIFNLTQEEAAMLMSDLRVRDVHLLPEENPDVIVRHHGQRYGTYDRSQTLYSANSKNYSLIRSINPTNNYGATTVTNKAYSFNLDGTGVDVVIMDTGVEQYHPEFAVNADGTGGTRVVDYDWTQHGIITSVPTGGFLGDCDGHGTNVASIVAGNTCGWAPGARIYTLRIISDGTAGPYRNIRNGQTLTLVSETQAWGSIRAFHNAKTVDPSTGYKRPTIVNCSYGYLGQYRGDIYGHRYRGVNYNVGTLSTTSGVFGTIGANVDPFYGGYYPSQVSAINSEIVSTINAGVHVVAAAGNELHKIDVPGGVDYDNYWIRGTSGGGTGVYYHRGGTPAAATGVISVGCISATTDAGGVEHKKNFSNGGPGVHIWAHGDFVTSAWSSSTVSGNLAKSDPRSSITSSTSVFYLQKISGTSQAAPQVAGVGALTLQLRPWMTPAQLKSWTTSTAVAWTNDATFYYNLGSGGNGTYTSWGSLMGSASIQLYMPYNSSSTAIIS